MKHLIIYTFIILFACNHKKVNSDLNFKNRSSIIIKDGSFIEIKLNVRPLYKKEIFADLSVTNNSEDSILFYNTLLPMSGILKSGIFSLFKNENLDQLKYIGARDEQYIKVASDDEGSIIVPKLRPDNFITILPKQTKSCTINLSNYYDFSEVGANESVSLTYANFLPAVSNKYEQIFEKDTVDGRMKPVYYDLTLPKKQFIDSMRVQFKLSD